MTKNEIINKYGIEEYNHRLERHKEWDRRRICKEYEKIENYELAKADNFEGWEVHHRLELTINGEFAHDAASLKRLNMYYSRPYFELIYLTTANHAKLHSMVRDITGKNNPMYGRDQSGKNNPRYGKVPWNKGKKGLQVAWNKGLKMKK